MTKKSGVKGKTVHALARAQSAARRLATKREPRAQLVELDHRPGEARRERQRLGYMLLATDPEIVTERRTERPTRAARTRRRAKRKAGK